MILNGISQFSTRIQTRNKCNYTSPLQKGNLSDGSSVTVAYFNNLTFLQQPLDPFVDVQVLHSDGRSFIKLALQQDR